MCEWCELTQQANEKQFKNKNEWITGDKRFAVSERGSEKWLKNDFEGELRYEKESLQDPVTNRSAAHHKGIIPEWKSRKRHITLSKRGVNFFSSFVF